MTSTCDSIYKILCGDLQHGIITNLYGPPSSGKTNIAFLATKHSKNKSIFIDTENGFSFERLKQIDSNINKIILFRPKNFTEQENILHEIKNSDPSLIVVDSMVSLYRLECCESDTANNIKRLAIQLHLLSNIAIEKNIPILITNQVYKDFESNKLKQIGGDSICYWAKISLELQKLDKPNYRKAILRRHPFEPEGHEIIFKIINNGIEKTKKKFGFF